MLWHIPNPDIIWMEMPTLPWQSKAINRKLCSRTTAFHFARTPFITLFVLFLRCKIDQSWYFRVCSFNRFWETGMNTTTLKYRSDWMVCSVYHSHLNTQLTTIGCQVGIAGTMLTCPLLFANTFVIHLWGHWWCPILHVRHVPCPPWALEHCRAIIIIIYYNNYN